MRTVAGAQALASSPFSVPPQTLCTQCECDLKTPTLTRGLRFACNLLLTMIATKPHKCCQRSPTLPTVHGMLDRHSTGSTRTQIAEPPRAVVDVPLSPQLAEAVQRVTRGQLSMCHWVHICGRQRVIRNQRLAAISSIALLLRVEAHAQKPASTASASWAASSAARSSTAWSCQAESLAVCCRAA